MLFLFHGIVQRILHIIVAYLIRFEINIHIKIILGKFPILTIVFGNAINKCKNEQMEQCNVSHVQSGSSCINF